MMKSQSQTLITGVYRTGTEFVTQLLNCHPNICATMYRVNVLRFVFGRYDPISKKSMQVKALDNLESRINDRYKMTLNKNEILQTLSNYEKVDYGIFYDVVMSSLYLTSECRHWAEKNQLLWREIPHFLNMMPNGKAVLVIRDPRSVLASFKKYTYAKPPAYLGAIFNCFDAMLKAKEYNKIYGEEQFICIRFEDIALNPEKWTKKIWKALNLSPDQEIKQHGWKDAYGRNWHANSGFHDNSDMRPFDVQAAINRWHTALNDKEVFLTEGVCGELMTEYKYSLSRPKTDWPNAIKLFAHDDKIMQHFKRWIIKGEGIEAFPTDPLDPTNWERLEAL